MRAMELKLDKSSTVTFLLAHVAMHPVEIGDQSWFDRVSHRRNLPAAYNQYRIANTIDPRRPLPEPLFVTSWSWRDIAKVVTGLAQNKS